VCSSDLIIRKLKTFNDYPGLILGPSDFDLLSEELITRRWVALVVDLTLKWPPSKSWPVLDILRARILNKGARSVIDGDSLVIIVNSLAASQDLDDFAILMLFRLIGNMFMNYVNEALTSISILEVMCGFGLRLCSFATRTQLSWVNAAMNFSTFLKTNDSACDVLIDVLIDVLAVASDEEVLYRLLYAIGNVAAFSEKAMNKLRMRPDLIDAKMALNPAARVSQLLVALADMVK
jgi:hypothetical protein